MAELQRDHDRPAAPARHRGRAVHPLRRAGELSLRPCVD
jgi:hypothetical protein